MKVTRPTQLLSKIIGGPSPTGFSDTADLQRALENNSGLLFVISNNDSGGRSSSSDDMEVESIQDESMVAVEDAAAVDRPRGIIILMHVLGVCFRNTSGR